MISRSHQKGDTASVAVYSDCEAYRYELTRQWDATGQKALFVLLNPSTATEFQNDPTVERCERRARALGFGAFRVINIFAYRATDPKVMRKVADPVGPENDAALADGDAVVVRQLHPATQRLAVKHGTVGGFEVLDPPPAIGLEHPRMAAAGLVVVDAQAALAVTTKHQLAGQGEDAIDIDEAGHGWRTVSRSAARCQPTARGGPAAAMDDAARG